MRCDVHSTVNILYTDNYIFDIPVCFAAGIGAVRSSLASSESTSRASLTLYIIAMGWQSADVLAPCQFRLG